MVPQTLDGAMVPSPPPFVYTEMVNSITETWETQPTSLRPLQGMHERVSCMLQYVVRAGKYAVRFV